MARESYQPVEARSRAPFLIQTEREEWVPLTAKEDIRLFSTTVDVVEPLLRQARVSAYVITGAAAVIGHQALMQDSSPRRPLSSIDVLIGYDSQGRGLREIGKEFLDLPLPGKKITTQERLQDLPSGFDYRNTGFRLEADGLPPINISDQWRNSLSPDATENGSLYNVTVELPTDEDELFGHYTGLNIQDRRSGRKKKLSYIPLSSPFLIRMMKVASAEPEDIQDLGTLARMGYFRGVPTLLPTGGEYDEIVRSISHRPEIGQEGLEMLNLLKDRVRVQFRWTQLFYDLLAAGELPKELMGLPSEQPDAPHKLHEWIVNRVKFDRPFPDRDYKVVPELFSSAEEHNKKFAEKWLEAADEYEGGREKFWVDMFTLSTQEYIKTQHANLPPAPLIPYLRLDLTDGYHGPHHTGNIVVRTRQIMEAMHIAAPEFVSQTQIATAEAAAAGHDVIQLGDFFREEISFGGETISRIKRKARTGTNDGDNEIESSKITQKFMSFVNGLYEVRGEDPIFDPQAGYESIRATAPIKNPDGTIDQTVFESSRATPEVQALLLADIGAENGMAIEKEGVEELERNSWGMIWEEEVEVRAARLGYRLEEDKNSAIKAVPFKIGGPLSDEEKERLTKIMKARLLGQKNFNNDRRSTKGRSKILEQISQMDPRVQEAVETLFLPGSDESKETLAIINYYYQHLQDLGYKDLMNERSLKYFRQFPDFFADTHSLPEDFPLYEIIKPAA